MTDVTLRMVGEDAGTQQLLARVTTQLDNLDKATGKNKDSNNWLKKSYTELNSGLSIAKQAFAAVEQVVDKTIGSFMRQADAVRSLALATGTGVEETSRMIEVFDDAGIKTDGLRAAMIAMKNAGVSPSIESIAQLSDEYRAITDPLKKVEFLTEKFGARGVELGKVFDQTGDQIRKAGAAVSESLIFDKEKIELAEKARIAQDNWNDTLKGFTNEITMFVLPGIMNLIGGISLLSDAQSKFSDDMGKSVV